MRQWKKVTVIHHGDERGKSKTTFNQNGLGHVLEAAPVLKLMEEMRDALQFMTMPITAVNLSIETLLQTIANDDERGKKALAAYEAFIKEVKL